MVRPKNQMYAKRGTQDWMPASQALVLDGYPAPKEWTKGKVALHFGRCTDADHRLQVIQQNKLVMRRFLTCWECPPGRCLPLYERYNGPTTKNLSGECYTCGSDLSFGFMLSRLQAIYTLKETEFWKAVIPRAGRVKSKRKAYVYEGSGRCNLYGHPNHCMSKHHLTLETYLENSVRKMHHRGDDSCACDLPCIGRKVRFRKERDHVEHEDENVFWAKGGLTEYKTAAERFDPSTLITRFKTEEA